MMSSAEKKNITLAQAQSLRFLRRLELLPGHRLAGLQPLDAAQARQVKQHATPDDAVRIGGNILERGSIGSHTARGFAVIKLSPVSDVAQRVDMTMAVAVEFSGQEIRAELGFAQARVYV